MALLAQGQLTLADWSKRLSPDGKIAPVAEVLSQANDILEDIVFVEGNLPTGHRTTIRTGLPAIYWRSLNMGVPSSKSSTAQVDEGCGMMEARSKVDVKLLNLNGNSAAFRLSEDDAFIEGMNQEMASTIFTGNPAVDPKKFLGLASRLSSTSAGNGNNVILAGGSGSDNASVYLIGWGEKGVHGIFPKGSQAGLMSRDLGEEAVSDGNGGEYQAARSLYQWDAGLVVRDWRFAVRIANIDVSDWIGVTGTQALTASTNLIKLMTKAIARMPNFNNVRLAFYANRTIEEGLRIQALERSQSVMKIEEAMNQFGSPMKQLTFQGIPVRRVDALGIAETLVS